MDMDKDKIVKKWAPIIESMGITGSKSNWAEDYCNIENDNSYNKPVEDIKDVEFPSILPMFKRVATQTIGLDLVSVKPMGGYVSDEDKKKILDKLKSQNRDAKISAIIDDGEYVEKKLEDDPEYKELMSKGMPTGKLFYIDYKYGKEEK
jgi:hypothetical protein